MISYKIFINNTRNVDVTGVAVNDPLLGSVLTGKTESTEDNDTLSVYESFIHIGSI